MVRSEAMSGIPNPQVEPMQQLHPNQLICAGVIPAAGQGLRLGGGQPKALRELEGLALYLWAVRTLASHPRVSTVVVATPAAHVEAVHRQVDQTLGELLKQNHCRVWVCAGGDTRQESVRAALGFLPPEVTHVLVHDAARPLTPGWMVEAVVGRLAAGAQAVVPALPVADTIKQIRVGADAQHPAWEAVTRTLPREQLRAVQTPQGFAREVLVKAHEQALSTQSAPGTDDASLIENMGVSVSVVAGAEEAFKITTSRDFAVAVLACEQSSRQ